MGPRPVTRAPRGALRSTLASTVGCVLVIAYMRTLGTLHTDGPRHPPVLRSGRTGSRPADEEPRDAGVARGAGEAGVVRAPARAPPRTPEIGSSTRFPSVLAPAQESPAGACCALGAPPWLSHEEAARLDDGRLPIRILKDEGVMDAFERPGRDKPRERVTCDVPCDLVNTSDAVGGTRLDAVIVVWQHAHGVWGKLAHDMRANRWPQLHIFVSSMESSVNYNDLEVDRLRALGRESMTTSLRSTVPVTYIRSSSVRAWGVRAPSWTGARVAALPASEPLAVLVASNCHPVLERSERFARLREALGGRARHLGRCGTSRWPSCGDQRCSKLGALRQYPFYLAWENSAEEDYVTEKVFDALDAGVVPVYLGAPNAAMFLPPNSTLFISADEPAGRVAKRIAAIAADADAYDALHAWRARPLPSDYRRRWAPVVRVKPLCRVCRWVYAQRHAAAGNVSWDAVSQSLALRPPGEARAGAWR